MKLTSLIAANECFRALGFQSGELKDSQISASSTRADKCLPYGARTGTSFGGWIPLKTLGDQLLTEHFIQVDLREMLLVKVVSGLTLSFRFEMQG